MCICFKYNFCWNYSTFTIGVYLWKDRVVLLSTKSGKDNHIAFSFTILMCNTKVCSFGVNGMYKIVVQNTVLTD